MLSDQGILSRKQKKFSLVKCLLQMTTQMFILSTTFQAMYFHKASRNINDVSILYHLSLLMKGTGLKRHFHFQSLLLEFFFCYSIKPNYTPSTYSTIVGSNMICM